MKSICVFCGSNMGINPVYQAIAEQVGRLFAEEQIKLVYGGAQIGLMGVIANAALAHGGEVIGVIPEVLIDKELAHKNLTTLEVVDSMQTRKARMADLSDAFLVLPGGLGSMDELFEVWTWVQVGLHDKPSGLLNVNGYYNDLLSFLDRTVSDGFVSQNLRDRLLIDADPKALTEKLLTFKPDTLAAKYQMTNLEAETERD